MKAQELRIGNYVRYYNKSYQLTSIQEDNTIRFKTKTSTIGCFSIKRIKPIPLTDEWLIKFGFEHPNNIWYSKFISLASKACFEYFYVNTKGEVNISESNNEYFLTRIKHVHQLQNLYFALTGQELEIK